MSRYGRDDEQWDRLVEAGHDYLVECARRRDTTSYTELNRELVRRTGLDGFDFGRADGRAAIGHLLGLIVERDVARTGLMLSALVIYENGNDAGSGFYALATQLGLLAKDASRHARERFWIDQTNALYDHYSRTDEDR